MPISKQDAQAIVQLGRELGVDPISLGGLMEMESGIDPNIWGGAGGKYRGLIQFGPAARSEVGLPNKPMTIAEQIPYVRRYFQQRGFTPGKHGVTEMYRTVLVGNPYQSGTDTSGTESDATAKRMLPGGDLYERARKKLEGGLGAPTQTTARAATAGAAQQATKKDSGLGAVLLNKFIDMLGVMGGRGVGPRSSLPTPELPDYSETETQSPELSLLTNVFKEREQDQRRQQALEQSFVSETGRNVAAAEAAKAQLLAQALGAFRSPSSVI